MDRLPIPAAVQTHSRPFPVTNRMVIGIAAPMTLAFLTTPLLGIVDTAVVGQFGDADLIGGLALGAVVFDLVFSTFNFLRSGTTGLVAQAFGRGDRTEEQAVFWRALAIGIASGLLLILASGLVIDGGLWFMAPEPGVAEAMRSYVAIRLLSTPMALANYAILGFVLGRGEATLGLAFQLLLNGVNIAMSIWLGLVLGWGIEGVAWGTVIGETAAFAAGALVVVFRFDRQARPGRARVFEASAIARMFAINRDIMLRTFLLLTAFAFFARTGTQFGAVTLAANAVLLNFFAVSSYFLDGIATAAEQIAGRAVGANYRPAFDRGVRLTFVWGLALAATATALFLVLGNPVVAVMAKAADVQAEAAVYLPWAAATALTGLLAFQMDGVFIGATWSRDMRNMMILSLIAYFAALHLLLPPLGNHGLWLAINLFLGLRGLTLLAILPRRADATFGGRAGSDAVASGSPPST